VQKITPFLWFDKEAGEAANFYVSIFKDGKILNVSRYGQVMVVKFELMGQTFMALNGGPLFKFTEAISFMVDCQSQEEVDYYWDKLLSGGGKPSQCGWLKDKYGLSWQIVPTILGELMSDKDPAKSRRVMEAMLKMVKMDVAALKRAYEGHGA